MNLVQYPIRKWFFITLAFGFQIVSFYASFEGIKETFVSQPFLAGVFAAALNLSLLAGWHEFQHDHKVKPEDDGFAKRRSLALLIGSALLCLSAFLSSVGMYSLVGWKSGTETDSAVENGQVLQQIKEIFNKVKDAAAKNLDAQKTDLAKKLDAANKRLSITKREKGQARVAEEVRQLTGKIKAVDDQKEKLALRKPNADEKLTLQQRNAEIQTQIANLISDYGVQRDTVLSADDKKHLGFDAPVNHNLYDQLVSDLQNRKPLAIASVAFGISPDILAVGLMFIATPRKKAWRRVRDVKAWTVQLGREIITPVDLPIAAAIEVVVNDMAESPLAQLSIPIDVTKEVSEEAIRAFFPAIVGRLIEHFGRSFEIRDLPNNWRETLTAGEALELTAIEV